MPLINAEGTYNAVVLDPKYGWYGESSRGTKYIRLALEVNDPASTQHGRHISWYGYFGDNQGRDGKTNTERLIEQLESVFGINWDWEHINFAGHAVEVVVEEDNYNGKQGYKAKYINNPNSSSEPKDSKESLEKSNEIAKALNIQLPRRGNKPTPKPAPRATPKEAKAPQYTGRTTDDNGDDIPF